MLFMLGCKKIWKVSINNVDDDIVYVISTNIESIFDKWYKIEDKFNHNKDDIKSIEVDGADPDDIEYFEDSFKKGLIDITK